MKYKAELHIHSILSACADNDNTVGNIIGMSQILGLDIIAISDHNAVYNYPAGVKMAEKSKVLLIPAMEVTTSEDIHVLCLFSDYESALLVCNKINKSLPQYPLDTEFFLPQRIVDENDMVIEEIPNLLSVGCGIGCYELFNIVEDNGGVAIPAHVDKEGNGMIAILGEIPYDLNVTAVEVSANCSEGLYNELKEKYIVIKSTDAHCLEKLCESDFEIELKEKTALCLVNALKKVID